MAIASARGMPAALLGFAAKLRQFLEPFSSAHCRCTDSCRISDRPRPLALIYAPRHAQQLRALADARASARRATLPEIATPHRRARRARQRAPAQPLRGTRVAKAGTWRS